MGKILETRKFLDLFYNKDRAGRVNQQTVNSTHDTQAMHMAEDLKLFASEVHIEVNLYSSQFSHGSSHVSNIVIISNMCSNKR